MKKKKTKQWRYFKTAGKFPAVRGNRKTGWKKGIPEVFEIHDLSSSLPAGSVQNKEKCNRVLTSLPVCSLFLHAKKRQDLSDVGQKKEI